MVTSIELVYFSLLEEKFVTYLCDVEMLSWFQIFTKSRDVKRRKGLAGSAAPCARDPDLDLNTEAETYLSRWSSFAVHA